MLAGTTLALPSGKYRVQAQTELGTSFRAMVNGLRAELSLHLASIKLPDSDKVSAMFHQQKMRSFQTEDQRIVGVTAPRALGRRGEEDNRQLRMTGAQLRSEVETGFPGKGLVDDGGRQTRAFVVRPQNGPRRAAR